ncbi:Uncharacterised protein [uncultured archaeon]|nr:Uncharacterised protein [uncultured archaeon]
MPPKGNPSPKPPSSSGIPSADSLWLPPHQGKEIKRKGGLDPNVHWAVEDVVDFIFPRRYQPTYHIVACDFLNLVLASKRVGKKEISEFLQTTGHSKSTLENKVVPKLARFGLIKRERLAMGTMGRGRPLVVSESLTFSNYLSRIAGAWNVNVVTARKKKGVEADDGF